MSSPNPGISAAGEAAGRTALDPSTGPAAIGGMLSPGETDAEPPPPPARRPPIEDRLPRVIRSRPRNPLEDRLTAVVSEISNLAIALEALSLKPRESQPPALRQERGGGEVSLPPPPSEAASAGNQGHSTFGLGATAAAPAGITGYASLPITATDTHRQAASYRRR